MKEQLCWMPSLWAQWEWQQFHISGQDRKYLWHWSSTITASLQFHCMDGLNFSLEITNFLLQCNLSQLIDLWPAAVVYATSTGVVSTCSREWYVLASVPSVWWMQHCTFVPDVYFPLIVVTHFELRQVGKSQRLPLFCWHLMCDLVILVVTQSALCQVGIPIGNPYSILWQLWEPAGWWHGAH